MRIFIVIATLNGGKNKEQAMAGIEREESILLIEHAISAFKHQGKVQSDLAEFLGTEATRLSEGKKGTWRLMPAQKELIIQEFGYPRQGKGVYVNAEHYLTVTQFIDSFHDVGNKRFYQRLSKILRGEDYLNSFLKKVWLVDGGHESNDQKLTMLNEYIDSEDFSNWFNKVQRDNDIHINLTTSEAWKKCGLVATDGYNYEVVSNYLYRVGLLKLEHNSNYVIGSKQNENLIETEFVLSGDILLDTDIPVSRNRQLESPILIPKSYEKTHGYSGDIVLLPDSWDKVSFKLFLSESMRYNVLIYLLCNETSFDYFTNQRHIVIEDLDQVELFLEIEKLRKFFGEPFSYENSIKYNIAASGGHVPGARRL